MKKFIYILFILILNINSQTFADTWVFWSCLSESDIKSWDKITLKTIPCMITELIDVFLWIAWTVAIIFIIIWAYQMLFGSLAKDNAKWKQTIIYAISWFVLASFSWLIIKFILDNFTS